MAQPPAQGSPIPRIEPPAPPPVSPGITTLQTEEFENLAPSTPHVVSDVAVEGARALAPEVIAAITKGLVGPATATSDIEDARLALLRAYRRSGYPLVTVSASLTTKGRLRFVVTEGHIADVKLEGDIGPAGTKVLEFLRHLVQSGPTSADDLERWLLLAADVPGVTLQTVLRPSETDPGALILVARVSRTTFSGFVAADNRAYRYTGPEQILGVGDINSLTSLGERTEISFYHTLLNSSDVFGQAAFESFLGSSGLKLRVYGGAGETLPGGPLSLVGYLGQTQVAGAQLTYPLIYTRQQKLNLAGSFDLIDSAIILGATGSQPSSKDDLRIFRAGADYVILDTLIDSDMPATNQVSGRLSKGIEGLGSSHTGSITLGRQGAVVDFVKFSAEVSRNQTLFSPWNNATVSFLALAAGQYSSNILPSEEQFYLGGLRYTRGFYSGEVAGDKALAATGELQLNTGVTVASFDIGLQFYGFYDWGATWQNAPLDPNKRLRSVGIGVRTMLTQNLEVDLEGVSRLTRQPDGSSNTVKPLVADALYWRVVAHF